MDRMTYTVEEVAEILGISRNSAYAAVSNGELKGVRIGRRIVIPKTEVDALLRSESKLEEPAGQAA